MSGLRPIHLLAGGRQSSREPLFSLLRRVFKDNDLDKPVVAYVGTANGDDESFYQRMADALMRVGAGTVSLAPISGDGADLGKARDVLASADVVFVSGGDVYEGIQTIREKDMMEYLCGLYEGGKPFFGLSAGSIMLAEMWIRWVNPDDDSTAELFPCLGFARIICDTHGEADDWEELRLALKFMGDDRVGYGIVSGTAIKVQASGEVEALGGAVNRLARREGRITRLPDILPST